MNMASVTPAGWSAGVLWGLPIAAVILLVIIGLIVLGHRLRVLAEDTKDEFDADEQRMWGNILLFGGSIALIIELLVMSLGMWPYKASYHRYYHVTGTVNRDPGIRMVAEDKSMSQRIVLVVDGIPYGVDDTRATLVHKGDHVDLMCKRDYQFRAASGWVCNWNGGAPQP